MCTSCSIVEMTKVCQIYKELNNLFSVECTKSHYRNLSHSAFLHFEQVSTLQLMSYEVSILCSLN